MSDINREMQGRGPKRGDISMLLAMQVNYQPKKPSQYVQVTFELIKQVHKAVQDYGLQVQYTMGLSILLSKGSLWLLMIGECFLNLY